MYSQHAPGLRTVPVCVGGWASPASLQFRYDPSINRVLLGLQMHGCLLQARTLLEINAQAVDSAPLLKSILPALQSTTSLMHPSYPCAPIRNEATLLAAAVLALTGAPQTTAMRRFVQRALDLCWLAILHSCPDRNVCSKSSQDVEQAISSSGKGSGENSSRQAADAAGSNRAEDAHNSTVTSLQRSGAQDHETAQQDQSSAAAANLPQHAQHDEAAEEAGYNRSRVLYDESDPMTSLWLKNATLLLFGHSIQQALGHAKCEHQGKVWSLKEEEVRMALQSGSYDVRAAVLKALIKRSAAGMLF